MARGATPRRSSAPGAPGLPRRFASCPIFILAMSPSPCSARARTKKASGTAPATGGEARASTQSRKRRQRAASAAPAASSNRVLGDSPVKSPSRKSWGYYVTTVRFQVYLQMPGREADRSLFRAPRCRVLQYRSRSRQSPGCGSEPVVEQFPPTLILAVPRIANLEPILAVHSVPTFGPRFLPDPAQTHGLLNCQWAHSTFAIIAVIAAGCAQNQMRHLAA